MERKPKPNMRNRNGHRRRQVREQVLAEEDLCGICRHPVDKELPHGLPGSAEVDEIQPVSLGGNPYDRANCRLVHRICNQRRGNGLRTGRRRAVPLFITTNSSTGGASPGVSAGQAHHRHSATDAASKTAGGDDGGI